MKVNVKKIAVLACILAVIMTTTGFAVRKRENFTVVTPTSVREISVLTHPNKGKEILKVVNERRAREGLPPLDWDPELAEVAMQRAADMTVSVSHMRPDGSSWQTASKRVWGENLLMGNTAYFSEDAVSLWMGSPGHRKNIMSERFTSMGAACVELDGLFYWVQLFGDSNADAEVGNIPSVPTASPEAETPVKTSAEPKTQRKDAPADSSISSPLSVSEEAPSDLKEVCVNSKGYIDGAKLKYNVKTQDTNHHILKNPNSIDGELLAELVELNPSDSPLILSADTTDFSGNILQGRIYLVPEELTNWTGDFRLGVYTEGKQLDQLKAQYKEEYENALQIMEIFQRGSLGTSTHIAVNLDLEGMNTENLAFYHYDESTKELTQLLDPNYRVDSAGYLHFYTSQGGIVVISEGTLTDK